MLLTSTQRDTIVAALEDADYKLFRTIADHLYAESIGIRLDDYTKSSVERTQAKREIITSTLAAVNAMAGVEVVPDGKHATQYDDDAIFVRGDVLTIVEAGGSHKGGFEARTRLLKGWSLIRTSEG